MPASEAASPPVAAVTAASPLAASDAVTEELYSSLGLGDESVFLFLIHNNYLGKVPRCLIRNRQGDHQWAIAGGNNRKAVIYDSNEHQTNLKLVFVARWQRFPLSN